MQTLILPGYHSKNQIWVDEVAKKLRFDGIIRPFYWAHWKDESSKFDSQEKALLIVKHIKEDKINIIAKSIGTLVTCLVWQLIPEKINKMILCGIPVNDIDSGSSDLIKKCIGSDRERFIGFQNVNDPLGEFVKVKDFGNIKLKERSDHEYPYFDDFNKFLAS